MREKFPLFKKKSGDERISARLKFDDSLKKQKGRSIFFTDPLTKKNTPQDRPPEFLMQDKGLQAGFNFLKQNGSNLYIKLHLAPHNSDKPELLGDTRFEEDLRTYDVVLLEGMGWTQEIQGSLEAVSRGIPSDVGMDRLKEYASVDDSYHLRLVEALNGSGAALGFYDVESVADSSSVQAQILDNETILEALVEKGESEEVKKNPELALKNQMAINLNVVALEALREWYMVCGIGRQLKRITSGDARAAEKLRAGNVRVLVIAGKTHQDLYRKLEPYTNVSADVVHVQGEKENPINAAMPRWLAQGYVEVSELEELSAQESSDRNTP